MIDAGRLREKIQVIRNERVPNASGGGTFSPVVVLDTFAEATEASSTPELIAQGIKVDGIVRFRIRYRPQDLRNGDMIIWRGYEYVLDNFKVDPLRTVIEMVCHADMNTSNRTTQTT